MNSQDWHASDEMLARYAEGEGGVALAASVEAHLMTCAICRERVAAEVRAAPGRAAVVDRAWTDVVATVERPADPWAVRLLVRLGLDETDGLLLSAARSLGGAWTLATVAIVVFSALAAIPAVAQGRALYLLVAPLVPVLGVVVAFGSIDPLEEMASATPYSKARLALLRALAVAVLSVPLSVAIGLAVPGIEWLAFAWLLPATALTLLVLVGMTWWRHELVAAVTSGGWLLVVATAYAGDDAAAVVRGELQLVYLAVAAAAGALLTARIRAARVPGGYA